MFTDIESIVFHELKNYMNLLAGSLKFFLYVDLNISNCPDSRKGRNLLCAG